MKTVKHKEEDVYNLNTTGDRIRFERTKIGMSQKELADYLHSTREQVNKLENNSRNISIEFLLELSDLFGVSTDYLLCRTNGRKKDESEMVKELGLTDEAIERLKLLKNNQEKLSQTINVLLTHHIATPFFYDCTNFLYRENERTNVTIGKELYTLDFDTEELILLEIQKTLRNLKKSIEGEFLYGGKGNKKVQKI